MINNPFAEAPRPQAPVQRPSKHRAGRQRPLTKAEKRRKDNREARETRKRISDYLNAKAVRDAVDG